MHNGVPFDVAFSLDEITRASYAITFSTFHGNEFDWDTFTFKERK